MKFTASLTVTIFSAASSGISQPNSSSNAITSSTVSRLSAPRSSMKLALSVTLASSTPRCSTTIFFTRSATSLITRSSTKLTRLILAVCDIRSLGDKPEQGGTLPNIDRRPFPAERPLSLAVPRGGLDHGQPAVDVQGLPGHVARLVARDEEHPGRDLLGRADPAQRDRLGDAGFLLVVQRRGHRRRNEAGRDTIDRHAALRDLEGERFRHADHAGLGGGIIRLAGIAGRA